ncbi:hypothetical protein BABINDRAFT_160471 [Babjeviella inositovora NRRL Y-12698]|uniref:Uncharacterized protein n=1 Tax=Babjeviella inositovora NRRL Y-12698 TaxID=984486 RepID=A0A1E3QTN7_9ASCO|nr:uncharacterized protein BABINDRAFT_160471 [Babjeviella inositovora NRRL Y-12698]ODQ81053.1 hypothetical protein BABINDRAFT_160471 [Babjeviella inositovora NRRL Y-12698]
MNSGRNKTKQLEIQKQQMQAEAKKADREKRREQNVKFTQQQEEKKTRLAEKKKDSDVPDLLPEDFLESLQNGGDESDNKDDAPASKHMKMEDFEEMERDEIRKQIKQQQAKALREAKKATIKKGPVRVTALSAKKIGLVPVSENRVTNARNKWMKRKSLGKR